MGKSQKINAVRSPDPKNPGSHITGVSVSVTEDFFPPVADLERIEKFCPNFTRDLMDTFKSQSAHRQYLEKTVIEGDSKRANRGQVLAFVLGMTVIAGGFWLISVGKDAFGIAAIIGALATLLTAFFAGSKIRSSERQRKMQQARSNTAPS